jgi:hypothetical protein
LRDWLDPTNSGSLIVDGWPIGAVAYDVDAGVQVTGIPEEIACGSESFVPSVILTNSGVNDLVSATITYSYNGSAGQSIDWTGSLAQFESTSIELPIFTGVDGENVVTATVTSPNGVADENGFNDAVSVDFTLSLGPTIDYQLVLILDDYGSEVTWELKELGQTLYSGGPYADDEDGSVVEVDFCLSGGCYIFEINDSYGDGLCCEFGQGSWSILDDAGELISTGGEFEESDQTVFCTEVSAVNASPDALSPVIFPNPAGAVVHLISHDWIGADLIIIDATGKVFQSCKVNDARMAIELSAWAAGFYVVTMQHPTHGSYHQRLIVD